MSTILPHIWCGLSANVECMSEMCCTRLAENTGGKKSPKNRHLGNIAQLFWAIFPLHSNRHHRSNGDCLEGKRENCQVCSVQYCAQQLCAVQCTHMNGPNSSLNSENGFCLTGPISLCLDSFLWPPYEIRQAVIFWPCGFFLLSFFYFSSLNLSGRRLDVCHTSTHGVALVRI